MGSLIEELKRRSRGTKSCECWRSLPTRSRPVRARKADAGLADRSGHTVSGAAEGTGVSALPHAYQCLLEVAADSGRPQTRRVRHPQPQRSQVTVPLCGFAVPLGSK